LEVRRGLSWVGILILYNAALTSLEGLNNVMKVVGNMGIGYNSVLADLQGLNNITSVERGINNL
jgi:hypothetical protein